MKLQDLLSKVPAEWHADFVDFIDKGEASPAFEKALDAHVGMQDAVEMAFSAKSAGLENFAKAVAETQPPSAEGMLQAISGGIAESLDAATQLAPAESEQVLALAAQRVTATKPESVERMQTLLSELQVQLHRKRPTVQSLATAAAPAH